MLDIDQALVYDKSVSYNKQPLKENNMDMNMVILPEQISTEWPCLMISKDEELLVMFSGPSTGMVIACNSEESNYCVGEYCNTWVMNEFVPFNGSITIKAVNGK